MRVQVKQGMKGHYVHGALKKPGEPFEVRGREIPAAFADKLERVPSARARQLIEDEAAEDEAGGDEAATSTEAKTESVQHAGWHAQLTEELGKEPTKEDLIEYAAANHQLEIDMSMLKDEMIRAIDQAERGGSASR